MYDEDNYDSRDDQYEEETIEEMERYRKGAPWIPLWSVLDSFLYRFRSESREGVKKYFEDNEEEFQKYIEEHNKKWFEPPEGEEE